jgi:hypothetical protein
MQRVVRVHISLDFGSFWRKADLGFGLSTLLGRVDEFWRDEVFGIPEVNQT